MLYSISFHGIAEVDIWSFGVICYIMLCGVPPFYDDDRLKMFEKIMEADVQFTDEHWAVVSPEAKDFVTQALKLNQVERWSAKDLMQHSWIQSMCHTLEKRDIRKSQLNLKSSINQLKLHSVQRLEDTHHQILMRRRSISGVGISQHSYDLDDNTVHTVAANRRDLFKIRSLSSY